MVAHNIMRNSDFTHLESKVWAAATGDILTSDDKLPSDNTSKTDVRGQRDNCSTGNVLLLELQRYNIFNPCALQIVIVQFILIALPLQKNSFCCLLRSEGRS